ncbi:MAG: S41 family peptidase [bacterium]
MKATQAYHRRVNHRTALWLFLLLGLLVLSMVPAAALGQKTIGSGEDGEENRVSRHQRLLESLKVLGAVYERIVYNYVDEIDPETVLEAGIAGMLEELDEHSQYLPPQVYEDLMLSTEGEFGGLGISINIRDHYPTVVSPIEGTPAYYMGIQGGDQIVTIEGESTYDFTSQDAVELLRGPPGTKVTIEIAREGVDKPMPFTITRDIIKVESVPYAFMIDDIGYIRVQRFSRTTADELEAKLNELSERNPRGLILDLRFNPGGLLDAAKEVSELFLEKNKLLVFTKGRLQSQNASFYSEPSGQVYNQVPMVVLVNGSSASASEIVAAALQDHDSALVVGKTTFGKGSVQTVYRLSENQALKLTTARYYTPSGRSIHKDRLTNEETGEEVAVDDGADDPDTELEPADTEMPRFKKETFRTDQGRVIYGGGGITPDIEIDQALLEDFEVALERDGALFSYASYYAARHEVPADFVADDVVMADFQQYLSERENIEEYLGVFDLSLSDSLYQANTDYIRWGIRRELMRRQQGPQAAYEVAIEADKQLHEALALFDRATSLEDLLQLAAEWNEEQLQQAVLEAEPEEAAVGN